MRPRQYSAPLNISSPRMRPLLSATLALTVLLASCGGGGGGGGGGDGGDPGGRPSSVSIGPLSPSTLSATLAEGDTRIAAPLFVTANYTGTTSGTVYILIDDPDRIISNAIPGIGPTTASLTFEVAKTLPAPGRYTKPVTVRLCGDAGCVVEFGGSPQTVAKDFTVQGVGVSASTLNFKGEVGMGAPAQTITVTPSAGTSFDVVNTNFQQEPKNPADFTFLDDVFDVKRTDATLQIKPKPAPAGRYTLTKTLGSGNARKTITAVYEVAGKPATAFTLSASSLNARPNPDPNNPDIYVTFDVLMSIPYKTLGAKAILDTPASAPNWLYTKDYLSFFPPGSEANNGLHVTMNFNKCGFFGSTNCLGRGTYTATVRVELQAFGETWTQDLPASFTVP